MCSPGSTEIPVTGTSTCTCSTAYDKIDFLIIRNMETILCTCNMRTWQQESFTYHLYHGVQYITIFRYKDRVVDGSVDRNTIKRSCIVIQKQNKNKSKTH